MSKSLKELLSIDKLVSYSPYEDYTRLNTILYCFGVIFKVWVVAYLWNIFIVRLGLPEVALAHMLGLWSVALTFLASVDTKKEYPKKYEFEFTLGVLANFYIIPIMGFVIGSIARFFI